MNKQVNSGLIEEFKNILADERTSLRQFYGRYIEKSVNYTKTTYKSFLADLEAQGMDSWYISECVYLFLKDSV